MTAKTSLRKRGIRSFFSRYGEDYLFALPYMTLFLLFTVVPVLISVLFSFTYYDVLHVPQFVGLKNYVQLIVDDRLFLEALKHTLILAVVTGPAGFFLSLLLAWLVNEFGNRMRAVLTLLFYAPVLSGGAYMIWQIIYSGDSYGYLNGLLLQFGFIDAPIQWLTDETYMMPAAIIVILWMSFGSGFLSFVAGFKNIDPSLYEAAAMDGVSNRYQELWYITLPSMKPQLMFGAVMSITGAFGMGDIISALFGFPSTNYNLYTLVHHMQDYGNIRFEMGYSSAVAVLLFFLMVGSNQLIQRLLRNVGN